MKTSTAVIAYLASSVAAHGVVTKVIGANGVEMPGLSIADGTPRDCTSNGCGSQADTSIIRDKDISAGGSPLGKTQGGGPVVAADKIAVFMGTASADTMKTNSPASGVGQEDPAPGAATGTNAAGGTTAKKPNKLRQLGNLLAGITGGGAGGGTKAKGVKTTGPPETMIKATAGMGSSEGMPTCATDGTVTMNFLQVSLSELDSFSQMAEQTG